ncbi:MAG: murein biosynthesis integral membrane protein MurJ [Cyanobacteria bacterium]|nr:murein biosynthesis integral membrane protein MurJ [Cyanobacteriota bacterium]MDW8200483.1 murein biosynthesis integral membrane protein MurJ [Cyanobacteriota bacterium SKYGB_h_bin112]
MVTDAAESSLSASKPRKTRSLASIATIVAAATLISKVFGLVRQQAIAAAFGVGVVADAYNYAYVIPGFLLILLGGINGPFHSAIVSALAKRSKEEAAPLVETITTLVGAVLLVVTLLLWLFAEPLIDLVAPGLSKTSEGLVIRTIAIQQFQIMAPMAFLAGVIGIGFGTLNAADHYWLPSISPLFSSASVILGLGILALSLGADITTPKYALLGGQVLAWTTLLGALWQWLAQVIAAQRSGLGGFRLRFNLQQPGIGDVLRVMGPATLASGMLQINVYTDLFFASFLPQAAAALGYAGLLVQTPLGIMSNMILVPLLPVFSRLTAPEDWHELKQRIRQGMMLTALTMLPLGGLMIALAHLIVRIVYERFAFDRAASVLVTQVLIAYSLGMFVYLGRDVIVRVFYGLGDANTPFRISVVNIFLNALLDYVLVSLFKAPGLVLATVGVNLISLVWMVIVLHHRLNGLPLWQWGWQVLMLTIASVVSGMVAFGVVTLMEKGLGTEGFWVTCLQLAVGGAVGLTTFAVLAIQLKLPEMTTLMVSLRRKLLRR